MTTDRKALAEDAKRLADDYAQAVAGNNEYDAGGKSGARLHAAIDALAAERDEQEAGDDIGAWLTHIMHIQNVAEVDSAPPWSEEFRAWYVPSEWAGVQRAACSFIGGKIASERDAVAPPPFPPEPQPLVVHPDLGPLFDLFAMQLYAMRYRDTP